MTAVSEHYDNHLAPYYSWLYGDFNDTVESNRNFFMFHDLIPKRSAAAVDLGSGSGFQSIALGQLGFNVMSFDLCQILLDELKNKSAGLPVTAVRDDISNFASHCTSRAELIVCMGDTLTHLDSFEMIKSLFSDVHNLLETEGKFVLTFRDLMFELKGVQRFIPVRSDQDTIFVCFLEYEKEYVRINDIIHKRSSEGWKMDASCYRKLRIPKEWVKNELSDLGFTIRLCENNRGMITVIAERL